MKEGERKKKGGKGGREARRKKGQRERIENQIFRLWSENRQEE